MSHFWGEVTGVGIGEDAPGLVAERLVGDLFAGLKTRNGADFQWASTRIGPGRVHLSFANARGHQSLFDFGWDGTTAESAVRGARAFQQEHRLTAPGG